MAQWIQNINRMAQNAITKGKEAAESSRLNGEIRQQEQKINGEMTQLGRYIAEHPDLLAQRDGVITGILERIEEARAEIARLNEAILELRGVRICGQCGTEVAIDARFCGNCGKPMAALPVVEAAPAEARKCPACGETLESGNLPANTAVIESEVFHKAELTATAVPKLLEHFNQCAAVCTDQRCSIVDHLIRLPVTVELDTAELHRS